MKKKLALFDLDGTLFNTNDVNFHAYQYALSKEGIELDYDYYCNECNGRHYKYFLPQLGITDKDTMERIHICKKNMYSSFLGHAKINAHIFELIQVMKEKYSCAVVTTASRKNSEEILTYFGKRQLFDALFTQEDIIKPKPAPEGFLLAMRHFAVSKEDTIIFEDSDVGVQAALATGAAVMIVGQF